MLPWKAVRICPYVYSIFAFSVIFVYCTWHKTVKHSDTVKPSIQHRETANVSILYTFKASDDRVFWWYCRKCYLYHVKLPSIKWASLKSKLADWVFYHYALLCFIQSFQVKIRGLAVMTTHYVFCRSLIKHYGVYVFCRVYYLLL